jgi:hypothetical protein
MSPMSPPNRHFSASSGKNRNFISAGSGFGGQIPVVVPVVVTMSMHGSSP